MRQHASPAAALVAGFFMRGRIGGMTPTIRNQLVEILAHINESIALAKEILANTSENDGTAHGRAEVILDDLIGAKSSVEAKLNYE
jgi:hypothetical protein